MTGKIFTALTKIEAEAHWSEGRLKEAMEIYTKLLTSSPNMTLNTRTAIEARIKELQASSPDIPSPPGGGGQGKKNKPQFEMPCSVCGKISKLNFEPDKSRPWFCKDHLEERQKMGPGARDVQTSRWLRLPAGCIFRRAKI